MKIIIKKSNNIGGILKAIPSKSVFHRALILSAISKNKKTILKNVFPLCEDVIATISCLRSIGSRIDISKDFIEVYSISSSREKVTINTQESGTTLRLLLPVVSYFKDEVEVDASLQLRKRPIKELVSTLKNAGICFKNEDFPILISNTSNTTNFEIRGDISSQYISGLLLLASLLDQKTNITLTSPLKSKFYVDITIQILSDFGIRVLSSKNKDNLEVYTVFGSRESITPPCEYKIEGDWSNVAFFLVLGAINKGIEIEGLDINSKQGDREIINILKRANANIEIKKDKVVVKTSNLVGFEADFTNIPDLFPIVSALACFSKGSSVLSGIDRLKYKESNRIDSTFEMLKNLGADVTKTNDKFIIKGKEALDGGTINSYNDHRIAMSSAVLATRCKGSVTILDPLAIDKSYPSFFDDFKQIGGSYDVIN